MCEICSKLTVKTPEQRHWRRLGVFIVNFEHVSHLAHSVSIVGRSTLVGQRPMKSFSSVCPSVRLEFVTNGLKLGQKLGVLPFSQVWFISFP